jgi:protein-disulfide isomerase
MHMPGCRPRRCSARIQRRRRQLRELSAQGQRAIRVARRASRSAHDRLDFAIPDPLRSVRTASDLASIIAGRECAYTGQSQLAMSHMNPSRTRTLMAAWAVLAASVCSAASSPPPADDQVVIAHREALQGDPHSPVLGDPHGDVTIIEFFDYACPFCKAVQPRLEQALRADPHVRLVLKEFPILTPESPIAARASLASMRQHKYREFHEALMAYHGDWGEAAIFATAKRVGLNMDKLRRDMQSPEVANEIIANFNLARALRIVDTPNFIVNDHILTVPSAQIDFPKVIAEARAHRS